MSKKRREGMAMVLVIIVILMIGAVIIPLAGVATQYRKSTFSSVQQEKALSLAEAAVAAAVVEMRNEVDLDRGSAPDNTGIGVVSDTIGDGMFQVTVSPDYTDISGGPYELTAVGQTDEGLVGIKVGLDIDLGGGGLNPFYWWSLYSGAIYADQDITLSVNSETDSYNSAEGTSGLEGGHVRSNGNIDLTDFSLQGDAVPGPGHSVTMDSWSEVTGSTAPASDSLSPPAPTIPDNPYTVPAISESPDAIPGSNDNATIDPSYYDSATQTLTVPGWDNITIDGGTYVFNDASIGGNTTLTFDGDTTIFINAGSSFDFDDVKLNVNGDLKIVGYGDINSSGWSDVVVTGSLEIHTGPAGSFYSGNNDDWDVTGDITWVAQGGVSMTDSVIAAGGNSDFWIHTGASLDHGGWGTYRTGGNMQVVADGPVSIGNNGRVETTGTTAYYLDANSSLTGSDSYIGSGGEFRIVSEGPVNFGSWSDMAVGGDVNIYLDPGASLSTGTANMDLTLDGNLYILSHDAPITFGDNDIEFNSADSTFDIFTTSTITSGGWNTTAAGSKAPQNLRWFSTNSSSTAIELDVNSTFYGQIYAPSGTVTMDDTKFYGAVVAGTFADQGWSDYHFDEALLSWWSGYAGDGDGGGSVPTELQITSRSSFVPDPIY